MQARLFEERLAAVEASWNCAGELQEAPNGEDLPPSGSEGVGTSAHAGFAANSRVGVNSCKLSVVRLRLQGVAVSVSYTHLTLPTKA